MTAWFNADGLPVYFPQDQISVGNGGEYDTLGLFRIVDIEINLADLTETETVQSRVAIPKNFVIGRVDVIADTAAATGVAIDVGLVRKNSAATEIDYDGILAAYPTASMDAIGETNNLTKGSSYAGALVGTVSSSSYSGYISASRTTSTAFTAGRVRILLYLYRKTATT